LVKEGPDPLGQQLLDEGRAGVGGEDDHRDVGRAGLGPEAAQHLLAGHVGQVQQDDVHTLVVHDQDAGVCQAWGRWHVASLLR